MKYFIRIIRILHDNIYRCPCNHIKLCDTWLQGTSSLERFWALGELLVLS